MNENKEKTAGNLANSVVEGYDYSVAVRMSGRAGAYSPTGGKVILDIVWMITAGKFRKGFRNLTDVRAKTCGAE